MRKCLVNFFVLVLQLLLCSAPAQDCSFSTDSLSTIGNSSLQFNKITNPQYNELINLLETENDLLKKENEKLKEDRQYLITEYDSLMNSYQSVIDVLQNSTNEYKDSSQVFKYVVVGVIAFVGGGFCVKLASKY